MLDDVTDYCRLFLIRHPELSAEHASRAVGDGDASLSRRGETVLVDWMKQFADLHVDVVAASTQPQAAQSAAAIATTKGLEVEADERLRDQHMGEWQGKEWDEVAKSEPDRVRDFFAEFGEVAAPGGESLGQAIERFMSWWTERRSELAGKAVVIVSSGAMVTGFAAAMLGMRLSRAVSLNLPHGGMGVLEIFVNGARIATWNPGALQAD